MALFASVSMGTLQSCKDDLSDVVQQNDYDHKVLTDQINALKTALEDCKSNCASEIASLKTSISNLEKQINDNKADADATKALAKQLEQDLKALSDKVALMYTNDQVDKKLTDLETLLKKYTDDQTGAVKTALETLINEKVTEINTLITKLDGDLTQLRNDFTTQHNALAERVTALETGKRSRGPVPDSLRRSW